MGKNHMLCCPATIVYLCHLNVHLSFFGYKFGETLELLKAILPKMRRGVAAIQCTSVYKCKYNVLTPKYSGHCLRWSLYRAATYLKQLASLDQIALKHGSLPL